MHLVIATPLVQWGDIAKIIAASFIGGVGLATAFGVLLFGATRAEAGGPAARVGYLTVSSLAGLFCLAAVGIGIWAMTQKGPSSSSSSSSTPKKAAALVSRGPRPPGA
jgi:hypothetical protein